MHRRRMIRPVVFVALALALSVFGVSQTIAGMNHGKDIVDTAASAGSFSTLVTAVKAAGLVETLKGEGPFSVFAPTDAAFAKLQNIETFLFCQINI